MRRHRARSRGSRRVDCADALGGGGHLRLHLVLIRSHLIPPGSVLKTHTRWHPEVV